MADVYLKHVSSFVTLSAVPVLGCQVNNPHVSYLAATSAALM